MSNTFTKTSLSRLEGVHPHLVKVAKRALELSSVPFQITEGLRTAERQAQLVKQGKSQTKNSRHLRAPNGFSHAIDVVAYVDGEVSWKFDPYYVRISEAFKKAAREMGVQIEWGGDWKTLVDGPHYQLPWKYYPGVTSATDPAPPRSAEDDPHLIMRGDKGDEVRALQKLLVAHGATIKVDGDFGPATDAAVRAFQKRSGLKVDGIVGPATLKALQ